MRPACLYDESFLNTTDIKKLSWTNSKNFELKVDSANIIDNSKCKKDADDKEFICTKPDASECAESSNGVLQTQLPSLQDVETKMYNLHYVIGIEAVGTKCPQENDKFVAVYPYRDWIEGFVWPKETEIRSSFDKRNGLKKSAECLNRHIGLRKNIELSQKDGNSETIAVQGEFPHLVIQNYLDTLILIINN